MASLDKFSTLRQPPTCTFDHQKLKYLQASTLYKQTTKILDDFEEKDDLLNQLINE